MDVHRDCSWPHPLKVEAHRAACCCREAGARDAAEGAAEKKASPCLSEPLSNPHAYVTGLAIGPMNRDVDDDGLGTLGTLMSEDVECVDRTCPHLGKGVM